MSLSVTRLLLPAVAGLCASTAPAQVLGPAFAADYAITTLPPVPGVPTLYGGIAFKFGNPMALVVNGDTNSTSSAMYEIGLVRDAAGHVIGYTGTATMLATAPDADGGLDYTSTGVLLYTTWPTNSIGQIKPGSTAPDRTDDLTLLGVAGTTGALRITPAGFPAPGRLRITTYTGDGWYAADLTPDGTGTFDIVNVALVATLPQSCAAASNAAPESPVYVDASYPGFAAQGVLVSNWDCSAVGAYAIDAQGNLDVAAPRREFLAGYQCSGATVDPVTGDFLFADYNGGSLLVVKPSTAYGAGCGGLALDSNLARLGLPLFLTTTGYPAGSPLGLQVLSFTQFVPGIPLTALGLTGCFQHTGTEGTVLVTPSGGQTTFQFTIPANAGFLGVTLLGQTYALAPGANPAGATASNGIAATIGN